MPEDAKNETENELTKSPVMRAWERERAVHEPLERRHALLTLSAVALLLLALALGITYARPYLIPAMRWLRTAIRPILD